MSEPLSASDRSSLTAERGPVNMAVGGLLVFEPRANLTRTILRDRIAERIHLIPRLRQRLEEPPLGLANPVWTDDTGFDLDWHVRLASVEGAGAGAELGAFVAREFSHRLDRARPLWEVTLIQGLWGRRAAVLLKAHHALVDGMAAIGLAALVLDPTPEPLKVPAPDAAWEPQAYDIRRHATRLLSAPLVRAARPVMDTALRALDPDPRRAAADARAAATNVRSVTEVALELARQRPSAPMMPLNRSISPNRRYAMVQHDLASFKTASKRAGGTINDAVLAVVAGMLARYVTAARADGQMQALTRLPVALVPVSVRPDSDSGDLGNRISSVFVDLPVEETDLDERIRAVNLQTRDLKESAAVRAGAILVGASGAAPPLISGLLGRAMGSVRAFNLVVSNVPGPQQPFYLNGVRLSAIYPIVPLNPANQGLTVGVVSYDGRVCFGLLADRDLGPDVDVAAASLVESLSDLPAATGAPPAG